MVTSTVVRVAEMTGLRPGDPAQMVELGRVLNQLTTKHAAAIPAHVFMVINAIRINPRKWATIATHPAKSVEDTIKGIDNIY